MQITHEQLRTFLLEALPAASSQNELFPLVGGLLADAGIIRRLDGEQAQPAGTASLPSGKSVRPCPIHKNDRARVRRIFWDLLIEGFIRPGLPDDSSENLPHYQITEAGRDLLAGKPPLPFDPNGYLMSIKTEIPDVDDVIVTYLTESLKAFRIGSYLPSTVMLGLAAEKALLLLIDAGAAALAPPEDQKFRKKLNGLGIKGRFDAFEGVLTTRIRPLLKKDRQDIDDLLDVQLVGMFDIIRNQRDTAGHPSAPQIDQPNANASLYAFPALLKKVYDLIGWLKANPI